jgi:hypothetical protein
MRFFISVAAIGMALPALAGGWSKAGASSEEFHRTRAICMLRQVEAENRNPDAWGNVAVFGLCMRANGWVLT